MQRIGWWWLVSCACNAGWIVLFVQGSPACVSLSCVLLFSLLFANLAICIKSKAWQPDSGMTWVDTLLVAVPFSIYASWTTVASILNVAVAGVALGWADGAPLSPSVWSAIMVSIAAVVNLGVLWSRSDPVYPLVYVWAAAAIYSKHSEDHVVATASLVCLGVVALADAAWVGAALCRRSEAGKELLSSTRSYNAVLTN
jgi:hypothetical protein